MNSRQPIATLIERDGPHADTEHDLFAGVTVIGRGADADVVLRDRDVSRKHLELRVTADSAFARDLGSKNGLIVDGESVDGEVEIRDGTQLTLGGVIVELCHDGARVHQALVDAGEVTRTSPRPRATPAAELTAARGVTAPLLAAAVFMVLAVALVVYGS